MKKLPFLAVLILITNLSANAQQFKKFGAGVYGGSQLFGKMYSNDDLSKISGFTAGVDLRYSFSKQPEGFSLHFQPGFNTFRQITESGDNSQVEMETIWKWRAFHLPVLLRYTFSSGKVRPFAEIGPMLRFRQALKVNTSNNICGIAGCYFQETNSDLHPLTTKDAIGLTAGAGVEVDLWKVTIPVSIRIQEGFGTFETNVTFYESAGYQNLKTRVIQVTAGINF
ncbi:outer membrane beta-barrel protein [Dyadobacter fanqingshengii]|uniref:PorT family protein n=1 Tax=Dyadobacter fanqingshengii TaxID=2906443 RepID=A0A9X1TAB3_9BACT|nr:outer membrane beta-barrel protein [Dyadobacter fanqingshengii]MCF0041571.1 PorT family protein [Dyadobacter fanqingshengii]USJ36712.1 PorT family protein [Dyadobacter fanqingshengii]